MIDIVPDKKVVKVNATVDDDINLILDAVAKVDAAYVLLVIPEGNDLITSPIGLKALRRKTLEKGKRMVLVVPAGDALEITKNAGFMATTSIEAVTNDVWQTVATQYDEYYHANVGMNSKKSNPNKIDKGVEYMNPVSKDIPVPEIITSNPRQVAPPEVEKPDQKPEDQKTENAPFHDLPRPNVTGMDFAKLVKMSSKNNPAPKKPQQTGPVTISPAQEVNAFNPDILPKKVGANIAKIAKKKETSAMARVTLGIIVVLLLFIGALFAVYYMYFPRVRIDLTLQAEPVTISDTAVATSAITGFDVNKKEVQLTREKSEQNGTKSFTSTETGAEGTKASGQVQFQNTDTTAKSFPAGTLVTAGPLKFATAAVLSIPAGEPGKVGLATVTVTASDLGEEYNVPSGTVIAVPSDAKVTGTVTDSSGLSGGTKRTFPVVGQKDVDSATKDLQTQLEQQAISELTDKDKDKGYAFIKESVKTEVKDKPSVSPAIGTEVKSSDPQPTVSMFTTSSALYYQKDSVVKLGEKLLLEKYRADKSLSNEDMANTTIEDLSVEIVKVTVDKNEKVTVDFKASGLATTKIDTDALRNDIVGKKWEEMFEIVSKLPALQKQPEIKFYPDWLNSIHYVPKETGRIDIHVNVVAPGGSTSR